jgi:hypothetical protein
MAYGEAQSTAKERVSLMDDTSRLNERLRETLHRLTKLGDTLHGSAPRDAGAKPGAPEPVPTLRRYLDEAHNVAYGIESELTRIENLL